MKKRIMLTISLLFAFLSCEVSFNSELREYIDNIEDRNPLDFTISDSVSIDDEIAINFGFSLSSITKELVIENNENVDIDLEAFDGISGNFTINSFDAFTLKQGESFNITVTYNVLSSNFNSRVSEKVSFKDADGRKYIFYVWATSKRQPLVILDSTSTNISEYDFGAWDDNRTYTLVLKNKGLEDISVSSVNTPSGISFTGTNSIDLDINEEVSLEFLVSDVSIGNYGSSTGSYITFISDHSLETTFNFAIYSGGELNVSILDNTSTALAGDVDFGDYYSGAPILLNLYLKNNSLFDISSQASIDNTQFSSDISSTSISSQGTMSFQASFLPSGGYGNKFGTLLIKDTVSNRSKSFQFVGNYSP